MMSLSLYYDVTTPSTMMSLPLYYNITTLYYDVINSSTMMRTHVTTVTNLTTSLPSHKKNKNKTKTKTKRFFFPLSAATIDLKDLVIIPGKVRHYPYYDVTAHIMTSLTPVANSFTVTSLPRYYDVTNPSTRMSL